SDGLIETRGNSGMYGEQRLRAEIEAHARAEQAPVALLGEVLDAVSDHSGGRPAADDLTLLVARVLPGDDRLG
ncbi:MAG: SpoIIE family protein phosphatase, partial [Planctomycetes bacterium]|nr:SpoIIE family protein phosphatase [Planctomycetota bacterium]